jgi:hypothetical protein
VQAQAAVLSSCSSHQEFVVFAVADPVTQAAAALSKSDSKAASARSKLHLPAPKPCSVHSGILHFPLLKQQPLSQQTPLLTMQNTNLAITHQHPSH